MRVQMMTGGLGPIRTLGWGVLAAGLVIGWIAASARGDEVRYFEKDGVTYEARTIRRPVAETTWAERQETVYVDRYVTEMQDTYRNVYVPVTEYVYQPRLHGWWNPFRPSYVAFHSVPRTRWEHRTEVVRRPVSYRESAPQTRVVRQPSRTLKMVEEERISRVELDRAPRTLVSSTVRPVEGSTQVAEKSRVGGVARFKSDPPRQGASPPAVLQR